MPVGEVTITLEDVATLSGLPIDGEAAIVDVPDREWSETCTSLLGHAPNDLSGGVVRLSWLREHFNNLPPNASAEIIGQFAQVNPHNKPTPFPAYRCHLQAYTGLPPFGCKLQWYESKEFYFLGISHKCKIPLDWVHRNAL
ncbi:unnamed protein product [Linum tenue]|uniref:Aminotransferase-like plant mobile domain-containing protein n=1 Tax=Linum tenue TaxID=586396 RepID=A0AAV0Q0Z4_9ROSI|nr:unnamed protein product [Linum tenue]